MLSVKRSKLWLRWWRMKTKTVIILPEVLVVEHSSQMCIIIFVLFKRERISLKRGEIAGLMFASDTISSHESVWDVLSSSITQFGPPAVQRGTWRPNAGMWSSPVSVGTSEAVTVRDSWAALRLFFFLLWAHLWSCYDAQLCLLNELKACFCVATAYRINDYCFCLCNGDLSQQQPCRSKNHWSNWLVLTFSVSMPLVMDQVETM